MAELYRREPKVPSFRLGQMDCPSDADLKLYIEQTQNRLSEEPWRQIGVHLLACNCCRVREEIFLGTKVGHA